MDLYNKTQLGSGDADLYSDVNENLLADQGFMSYLGTNNVDANKLTPNELTALSKSYTGLGNTLNVDSVNPTNNLLGNQDWGMKGLGGTALGVGQLGLGVMSYFDQKKTADAQRKILGQQADANAYAMEKSKRNDEALAKAFGTA